MHNTPNTYIPLPHRAAIRISGADKATFLQGLITNDIRKVNEHEPIYALMLSPQGKFLYDFFITQKEESFWLDISNHHKDAIIKKLSMYKLRSDVTIEDMSADYECALLIGSKLENEIKTEEKGNTRPFCKGLAYYDPRNHKLGARAFIERENNFQSFEAKEFSKGDLSPYEANRIRLGIPDGDLDMVSGDSFPLDFGLHQLNAIDFKKGCYVGQEVTARVYHKSEPKKAVYLVKSPDSTSLPEAGTVITSNDKKIGELRSRHHNYGLALLRKSDIEGITDAIVGETTTIQIVPFNK